MKIHVKLFASLREQFGQPDFDREVAPEATVEDLLALLRQEVGTSFRTQ